MVKFLNQHAKWIIAIFGFLIFGLSQMPFMTTSDLWQKTENALIDRRYSNRPGKPPDPNIVLIGQGNSSFKLDELSDEEIKASPTLQLMQKTTPRWDRGVYAAILEKLMGAGAKVVVFDFIFVNQISQSGDDEFAKTLQKYKDHVVIGEALQDRDAGGGIGATLITPDDSLLLPGVESTLGTVNIWPDDDGVLRHGIMYATSMMRLAGLDGYPDDMFLLGVRALQKYNNGKVSLPPTNIVNYIDYQGGPGTYEAIPVENLFVETIWRTNFNSGLLFSNKIVFVGPMAELTHDVHPTPFGEMPGPEIHAQMTAALLHGSWLLQTSRFTNIAATLLMLLLALGICLRIGNALLKFFMLVVVVVVFMIACQVACSYHKLVLPMTAPLFCFIVPGSFGVVFQYLLEQFERLRMRNLLGRYVSENVAKKISEDQRSFEDRVKGLKQPVTILFSDIRGFTSMTESTDPDKLVAQLNEYFLEMVGMVMKEGGTLQKFIGDAILAAWGDTHSEGIGADAERAVRAALQMRVALVKLNEAWVKNPDRKKLFTGIGVNHGEVIVGEIGHPQRMEFTVLGDGVNLAARLESATKQFHADILIGEEAEKLTREKFIYRNVGAIAFKGKTKPIEVFTLLGDSSQPPPDWLSSYHGAIRMYRSRQFEKAAGLFREAAGAIGGEDFLCGMYLESCRDLLREPPPEDWDGSFKLSEK
jgi:adenylate cyclase